MSATFETTFAFGAGIAAFFSPCAFALLPGYVGYYVATVERESAPLSGAFSRGMAASVGALVTFSLLSVVAYSATSLFETVLPVLEPAVGLTLIVLGVLTVSKHRLSFTVPLPKRRASIAGFGLFGTLYALAATACVLPLFLAITVTSLEHSLGHATLIFGAYGGGFTLLLFAATVTIAIGKETLFRRFASHSPRLVQLAGVVLILAGVAQLYVAFALDAVNPLG